MKSLRPGASQQEISVLATQGNGDLHSNSKSNTAIGQELTQAFTHVYQPMSVTPRSRVQQLASHGLMNVMVEAEGDTWIDDHHTCEDIGLPLLDS